ncbi:laminin subunit alpha [Neodiprion fabricii]|uniref:laminin subunit alpha n=1 Tax=Neodiprion fabricii TaxID=2872261 RepID=UPI001ED951C5|nr:laminin subunit alpha [Neodiprion fabricii]
MILQAQGLVILAIAAVFARGEILTPPYFNLADGREISATATCGVDTPGPELYCKLVGANADQDEDINLIQGQVCDYCDPNDPLKRHPPEYAVDGTQTWWQSPPLSRGMKYNEVNLTINLGQEFHVAYVYIRMGNSPRPGLWALEKSKDYGKTWSPWQYFSDSENDCLTYFGVNSREGIKRDDSVICTTEYSKLVPLEGGEIPFSTLTDRPSANHYFNSSVLQEWTRATNVRFRFLRTKNLFGHLMSVARQDPTVTRRYFYSIKDISIGGRCMCNGHADTCDVQDPNIPDKLLCRCHHNTCGPQCASCCKGFEQKKWRISTASKKFICEPCNCFGHTDECQYDPQIDEQHLSLDIHGKYEGGGVCQNCKHNTEGINCDRCKAGFYKPYDKHLNETDVCQPCNCDLSFSTGNCAEGSGKCECRPEYVAPDCTECSYGYFGYPKCRPCECHLKGTDGYHCEATDGHCPCKENYAGHYCNLCAEGYYNFPDCLPCGCNDLGATDEFCDVTSGNCTCKNNYAGRACDVCENGYFNYPSCRFCDCDAQGTQGEICDKTNGQCLCKEGYGGPRCDKCLTGFFGYPNCQPCKCSTNGSPFTSCDVKGTCSCYVNFSGKTCDQCSPGYYKYPECIDCKCDNHGAIGLSCDAEGKCQCHENFDGLRCDKCKEGFYNFPTCEGCNCDPAGVIETFQGCGSVPIGELCQCKERVAGRICNECKPLFWNLQPRNPQGCEECQCNIPGTIAGIGECDTKSGQCICKTAVTGRGCTHCSDGMYNLQEYNLFGCDNCACDVGGSINPICDKQSGQCYCRPRVTGRMCNKPLQAHYFPTLHQFQYEVEDGRTPSNNPVRYGFAEDLFPGYSWKGYAVFSPLQDKIIQDVHIQKSTLYRMVLRYINLNHNPISGLIKITPEHSHDTEQEFTVVFKPTSKPMFVTVAGSSGTVPSPLVMDPGRWDISISTKSSLLLDYFVLLPAAYYEATILTQEVKRPCEIGYNGLCRHFSYPSLSTFDTVRGDAGYSIQDNQRERLTEYFTDRAALNELGEKRVALINDKQQEIHYDVRISKPGIYILVVTYITPISNDQIATVLVEANASYNGKVMLYPCRYTSVCRQVVTDKYGRVTPLQLPSNYVSVILSAEPYTDSAIVSIVAIPYENWSLDYIKPKSVCVRKGGKCVQGIFPEASDAKHIEFEVGNEILEVGSRPPGIYDNSTKLIYLSNNNTMIDIKAKVPLPGEYVFVVQYFQPDHPEFELDVLVQNGKFYEAKIPLPNCPSNSGCRSIVHQSNGETKFDLIENFMITFKKGAGDNAVWLDYILVIPAGPRVQETLQKIQFDQTKEFIKKCGTNHFHINITDDGFCRDSVFSLTADYNNGAQPCNCDVEGTLSFECQEFGGQCSCRPNVIGRQCEICKTGFYGFPDCKPCNCPSTANCAPETGECICPPNVSGQRCDVCKPRTYGFDPIIGCEDCNCDPNGVIDNDLQCNLYNGNCNCKVNVIGRQCDKCRPGYAEYPYCIECECDIRGTTADICDQKTAECFCKSNVQGSGCDVCAEGTFDIQLNNPNGCTKCFCFGKTTRCSSASLYKTYVTDMNNWKAAIINEKIGNVTILKNVPISQNNSQIFMSLTHNETFENTIYFSAPDTYLGKRLTAYGGYLKYLIYYTTGPFGEAVAGADVILYGANTYLLYSGDEQPPSSMDFEASVQIVETNFRTLNDLDATRDQIMVVLEDLQGIYIRAKYWQPSVMIWLSYVTLDDATETYSSSSSVIASSVEQCHCPPNYKGLSCEECATGYYRVSSGPHGGYCVPCQCNDHSNTCDVNTGRCYDCKHSTTGDHCELCEIGYYGNATVGTPGDCNICACPLPIASNNFANSCQVNEEGDKISCDCLEGYYGARCQSCSAGFYGRPQEVGDYCKPCQCSGNIDPEDEHSCDSIDGTCLACLHNTYGQACNLCAPGFYGDAVQLKDCQSCICDTCGMTRCNNYNGSCECHPNVIGEKCDRCADNHYGFKSCQGCLPCDCGVASYSSQCDDDTGKCRCAPGVTGRQCDRCTPGYWNYGPSGCESCGCNTEYSIGASCDAETGHCTCLPGVIGDKCDKCPHRWVLIEQEGCFQCDSCAHDLLDDTDRLAEQLVPIVQEFKTVAAGYFTNRRLQFINETVDQLDKQVQLLNPSRVDFVPLQKEISQLDQDVQNQRRKVEYISENSEKWAEGAMNTSVEMKLLEKDAAKEIDRVNVIVDEVKSLALNIDQGTGPKVDNALKEAKEIIKKIEGVSFRSFRDKANDQVDRANILLTEMEQNNIPITNLSTVVMDLNKKVVNLTNKIDDMMNNTQMTQLNANVAERLNLENRIAQETGNFDTAKNSTNEAQEDLNAGKELNENATRFLNQAINFINTIKEDTQRDVRSKLNETTYGNDQILVDVLDLVKNATKHAETLNQYSLDLDGILTDTRNTSAVRAASAYKDISETINGAYEAAVDAIKAANNATQLSDGIGGRTLTSQNRSQELLDMAINALDQTEGSLEDDLIETQNDVSSIDNQNRNNTAELDRIESVLTGLSPESSSPLAQQFMDKADKVQDVTQRAINDMKGTVEKLPEDLVDAKKLSKDMEDSIHDISQANKQLDVVERIVPNITNLINDLGSKQSSIETTGKMLQQKIDDLKHSIANARELADMIKIGLTFYRNTTLELKNPESLPLLATSTKISAYFRTNQTNGFMLYLGNEQKSKQSRFKTNDFMALLVENGYPVLVVDLGSGPERIISNRYVADNVWRQVIVERTGTNIKLIIREDIGEGKDELFVKEQVIPGPYSIFNLDQDQSKLFVGGYPAAFQIQNAVTSASFEGEMEELVIGDTPVSFWNFVYGENNREGAVERDKLINFQPSTGYRFDGNGYAIISIKQSQISMDAQKFNIKLNFKTFAENGLMYLMVNGRNFFSLEMKDGHVLYQYNLGQSTAFIKTTKTFNDGNWHNLIALRQQKQGTLEIDNSGKVWGEVKGASTTFESQDRIYFGGHPTLHSYSSVTTEGFEGCIDQVYISDTQVDLSSSTQAFGVTSGCPVRFARLVSFEEGNPGYVKWENASAPNSLKVNLKFKTSAKSGLIYYATNDDQSAVSMMSLMNGRLFVRSQGEELSTSKDGIKFNDNEWHVVTATHDEKSLRLDIDDIENYITEIPPPPLHILYGSLYIGGLPPDYNVQKQGNLSTVPFVGCIEDATLNGIIINFANSTDRPGAFLGKCKGGDQPSRPPAVQTQRPDETWTPEPVPDIPTPPKRTDVNIPFEENDGLNNIEGRLTVGPVTSTTPTPVVVTSEPLKPVMTPAPRTANECHLPQYPANDSDVNNGWRFGTKKNSRFEYNSLGGRYMNDYDIQIDFKTMENDGIIFYSAVLGKQDLIAVYLKEGKVHYKFDCGSGPALLIGATKTNNNQWHTIVFKRKGNTGELAIDDEQIIRQNSAGDATMMDVIPPFYVGGFRSELSDNVFRSTGINSTFSGCLKSFMMNGNLVGDPTTSIGVIPCSKSVEPGLFFYPGNGSNYYKDTDKHQFGGTIDIQMNIKPRTISGHLLSTHGKRDYLVLEMDNGTVRFLVKTQKGIIETSFQLPNRNSLCDGNWHSIRATRQKNAVLLSVDNKSAPPGTGSRNIYGVQSKQPIFIGGHLRLSRARGSKSRQQYVGCINNVIINSVPLTLNPLRANGKVITGICPTI